MNERFWNQLTPWANLTYPPFNPFIPGALKAGVDTPLWFLLFLPPLCLLHLLLEPPTRDTLLKALIKPIWDHLSTCSLYLPSMAYPGLITQMNPRRVDGLPGLGYIYKFVLRMTQFPCSLYGLYLDHHAAYCSCCLRHYLYTPLFELPYTLIFTLILSY
jgi:hypothetical protein